MSGWNKDTVKRALKERLGGSFADDIVEQTEKDPEMQKQFAAGMHVSNCEQCQKRMQVIWDEIYTHSLEGSK